MYWNLRLTFEESHRGHFNSALYLNTSMANIWPNCTALDYNRLRIDNLEVGTQVA